MEIEMKLAMVFLFLIFPLFAFGQEKVADQEKTTIYVYANSSSTSMGRINKSVYLGEKEIAQIRPERFFIISINPGTYALHLKDKKVGGLEKEFEAGKTYYVKIQFASDGFFIKPRSISLVPQENGLFEIKQLKPIDKDNIKIPDLVRSN